MLIRASQPSTYFHCLVLDIFRPFLDESANVPLVSFEAAQYQQQGDIDVVYRASVNQLKRLVVFYLAKFDVAAHSALWRPALIYVLNALIRDARLSPDLARTAEWLFYFRACMLGLSKQLSSFHITDKIVQGILSMAVRDEVLSRADARKTLDEVRRPNGPDGPTPVSSDEMDVRDETGSFIVDLDLAVKDPSAATVDALVDQFDSLSMLAEVASMVIDED